MIAGAVQASPLLRCQVDQGGVSRVLESTPLSDPYTVAATDINNRFRFKAVMIGDATQVAYIKLYVYEQNKRQPVLIHQATYLAPVAGDNPAPAALTGINHVYAPYLERELRYGCALLEKNS